MPAATDRSTLSVRRLSRPLRCPHGHGVARESQPRRSRLRPDVAVGEDQALADHELGLDVGRAALRREVNDDALALDLPGDLPFLPVLVGAADEGLASVDRDLARAAGMGRVIPGARTRISGILPPLRPD